MSQPSTGPLSGLKVVDMTRVVAGPLCGQILGDLGADVIKIEKPGEGDDSRRVAPPWFREPGEGSTGDSTYFLAVNRNKRSLAVDFARPEGQEVIRRLASQSDILIENYRTGTLGRYGLGYADLRAVNPRLIYCSITGFGQTGPYSGRSGYDYLVQGMGGLMAVTGIPDDQPGAGPMRIGVPVADTLAGMNAAIALTAALEARHRMGEGQHIDISLFDSAVASLLNTSSSWLNAGAVLGRTGNDHPSAAPYGVFAASDGHVIVATFNDREFERLAKVLGRPEWLDDTRFRRNSDRVRNRVALKDAVSAVICRKTRAEWIDILNKETISAGPINDMSDLEQDEHAVARKLFVTLESQDGPVRTVASPYRLSATPPDYRLPPPHVGEHTDEILDELGYAAEQRGALRACDVL